MGQSLSKLYVHLTFSTKDRYPFIHESWENKLYAYMSGIFKGQDSPAIIINGVPDHVHILFILSKNKVLAKIVEEVKKQSSKWTKEQDFGPRKFTWQAGYADFSVSASKVEVVKNYILKQKEHHKRISFQDELRKFLEEYNIEYNEKYLWD